MLGGIVPTFIHYGLQFLNPTFFLVTVCGVCACISVLTGSSWTTIATIGVAFMGIGEIMGYSAAWIAGAVISGAYFGDKVSPLSDTTVVASSCCGVDLFTHIRFLLLTAGPSMAIAFGVFLGEGIFRDTASIAQDSSGMMDSLHATFVVTPGIGRAGRHGGNDSHACQHGADTCRQCGAWRRGNDDISAADVDERRLSGRCGVERNSRQKMKDSTHWCRHPGCWVCCPPYFLY